jgi:hypothetical protein
LASSDTLIIVKPATVIAWHRAGFRRYWTWRSRHKGGRPGIDPEVRALIKRMAAANLWGAPRGSTVPGNAGVFAAGAVWSCTRGMP